MAALAVGFVGNYPNSTGIQHWSHPEECREAKSFSGGSRLPASGDEIQRPVESSFSVHVLPVLPLLGHVDGIGVGSAVHLLSLGGIKRGKTHHLHHLDLFLCLALQILLCDLSLFLGVLELLLLLIPALLGPCW